MLGLRVGAMPAGHSNCAGSRLSEPKATRTEAPRLSLVPASSVGCMTSRRRYVDGDAKRTSSSLALSIRSGFSRRRAASFRFSASHFIIVARAIDVVSKPPTKMRRTIADRKVAEEGKGGRVHDEIGGWRSRKKIRN